MSFCKQNKGIPACQDVVHHVNILLLTVFVKALSHSRLCIFLTPLTGFQEASREAFISLLLSIMSESPSGEPLCSVQAVNGSAALKFLCLWPGGAPEAQVSFPGLSVNASGYGNYSMTINDIQSLNGREIICKAEHPLIQTQCSVIPRKSCSVSYWSVSYKLIPFGICGIVE